MIDAKDDVEEQWKIWQEDNPAETLVDIDGKLVTSVTSGLELSEKKISVNQAGNQEMNEM